MKRRSLFARFLTALILIPIGVFLVLFAVTNHSDVITLSVWPVASNEYTVSLAFYSLVLLFVGCCMGFIVAWFSQAAIRSRARSLSSKVEWLEWEVRDLKRRSPDQKGDGKTGLPARSGIGVGSLPATSR